MNKISKFCSIVLAGFIYLSPASASNFVCGQDLNNDDVIQNNETTSCSVIDGEQFCSVGAQNCNAESVTEYICGLNGNKYSNENICTSNCLQSELVTKTWTTPGNYLWQVPTGVFQVNLAVMGGGGGGGGGGSGHPRFGGGKGYSGASGNISTFGTIRANGGSGGAGGYFFNYGARGSNGRLTVNNSFPISTNIVPITVGVGGRGGNKVTKNSTWQGTPPTTNATGAGGAGGVNGNRRRIGGIGGDSGYVSIDFEQSSQQSCSPSTQTAYTCPTTGNSCTDVGGVQQCSPNKCIDFDETPPEIIDPPSVTVFDDGDRNAQGACLDQALMFTGRNLSCAYSGLTKNCCKDKGVVFRDSTGSLAGGIVQGQATNLTWQVVSAAYTQYTSLIAQGSGVEIASTGASWAAESAISNFGIDPTSIAISVAAHVVTEFISCGQQDTEAALLNGSGYCHYVGTYCSKKAFFGCLKKSKSYCCFNSKLGRIIQQQGREQMGIGWGSAKSPSCGGFTPAQFQAIDFSRIDMSEYYDDIRTQGSSLIQQNITDSVESYYSQIRP